MKDKDNILNFPSKDEGRMVYAPWIQNFSQWKDSLQFDECLRIGNYLADLDNSAQMAMFLYLYSCWHDSQSGTTEDFWNDEDVAYAMERAMEDLQPTTED
jgi:hypothetical protein